MAQQPESNPPKIIYILYMIGILLPILSIVGVVTAYVLRSDVSSDIQSHFTFQIRTFWISILFQFVGWMTVFIGIGWLVLLAWVIWLLARNIKGLQIIIKNQAHPNPTTWLIV